MWAKLWDPARDFAVCSKGVFRSLDLNEIRCEIDDGPAFRVVCFQNRVHPYTVAHVLIMLDELSLPNRKLPNQVIHLH